MKAFREPAGAVQPKRADVRPRAVLFDLDGTLVNTGPDIAAAVNHMLADMARQPFPVERILDWVGEGAARLVQRALVGGRDAQPPENELEHGLALFHEHYAAGVCVHSEPYPHARRVLEILRASDTRLGCVTNKPERLTRSLLEALELASMFDVVVGGDTMEFRKPRPEPVLHACREMNLPPRDAVYVGDSVTDCHAAEAAGIPMIAVTYGYNRGADLTKWSCAAMIDDLDELPEALRITADKPTDR